MEIYIVDGEHDEVIEYPGEGTDEVRSSVSWTLPASVENPTIPDFRLGELVTATGNERDNVIIGMTTTTSSMAASAPTRSGANQRMHHLI